MFQLYPPMGFGKRLAVWWSCVWRQMLVAVPVWIVATVAGTIWAFSRMHHGQSLRRCRRGSGTDGPPGAGNRIITS